MMKQRIANFLGGVTTADASTLAAAIQRIEAEREVARDRERQLSDARVEALLSDDDAQIDAIEKDLAGVQRQLDRYEVQLPELRKRHAKQQGSEQFSANSRAFDVAVGNRIKAARQIDEALAALGQAYQLLDTAGKQIELLQAFHEEAPLTETPVRIAKSMRHYAPSLAKLLQLRWHIEVAEPLEAVEVAHWAQVRTRIKTRSEGRKMATDEEEA